MPRKSRHSISNSISKISHCIFRRRTLLFGLYGVSLVLVGQIMFTVLINPSIYPTNDLENIVSVRSVEGTPIQDTVVYSSVEFTDAPVNTKQRVEVDIEFLGEVNIKWICEIYLTENASLCYHDYRFLSYEQVNNLQVVLDGRSVDYYHSEYEGKEYYTISGYNLTGKNKINKLEMSFQLERTVNVSEIARIPWIFNKNYAKIIHLPMTNIPVHIGNTSDPSVLSVNANLPFQRILTGQSGWVDTFFPPQHEWEKYLKETYPEFKVYDFPKFEFPIEQECIIHGNTYTFETRFTENNIADRISLVTVPTYGIPIMLSIFLLSPFLIPLLVHSQKKQFTSQSSILRNLLLLLEIYVAFLVLPAVVLTFLESEFSFSMLSYLLEIMDPIVLVCIFAYPAIFLLVFNIHRTK